MLILGLHYKKKYDTIKWTYGGKSILSGVFEIVMWSVEFFVRNIALGVGLAMDACAVSMANGFNHPAMKTGKVILIAFFFGLFQAIMPMLGFAVGYSVVKHIEKFIPWIALILLGFLGGKTIFEGVKGKEESKSGDLTLWTLFLQAIATSIDALSVGLTMADFTVAGAIVSATIIAVITFFLSLGSVYIGRKFGTKLGNKAQILGGMILIAIGLEIFITSFI